MKISATRSNATRALGAAAVASVLLAQAACAAEPLVPHDVPDVLISELRVEGRADVPADPRTDARTDSSTGTRADSRTEDAATWLEQGEAAYLARRDDEAIAMFERVVEVQPERAHAWLRLGNLHHRRGAWFKSLSAYRRVAFRTQGEGTDPSLRAKALFNVALINLELAQQALRTLERMGPGAARSLRIDPLGAAIEETRRRLSELGFTDALEPSVSPLRGPVPRSSPSTSSSSPSASSASSSSTGALPPREPHRTAKDARAARSRVDYFRGEPRP